MPAIKIPKKIKGKASFGEIPKTKDTNAPVQPPVPGKGIATKVISAIAPNFLKRILCFFRVREKSHLKNFSQILELQLKNFEIGSRNHKIKITGIIFPKTDQKNAKNHGNLYTDKATGIARRNSPIGVIAIKNVASHVGKLENKRTKSIINYLS